MTVGSRRDSGSVAVVASGDSSFVQTDRRILSGRFLVRWVLWHGKRSVPSLVWNVLRSDIAFSWFASDHAYGACRLARIFGRKSVVVVGGVDAARATDLGYGIHIGPAAAKRSRYALENSNRVLVVDDFLREEIARNAGVRRAEVLTVPLGFDTDLFTPDQGPRTNVLTVGYVTEVNVRRKGLATFVRAASLLPDIPFVLVGAGPSRSTEQLRAIAPPNVRLLPPMGMRELLEQYRRARVYVQASLYEGLPSALGEAMACGCVPVGTRVGGIPNLIGDAGSYVPPEDPAATSAAIRRAYDTEKGAAARRRIATEFPISRRRDSLFRILDELIAT